MRKFLTTLAVAAVFLLPSAAKANLVIDDFSTPVQLTNSSASGTTSTGFGYTYTVDNGSFVVGLNAGPPIVPANGLFTSLNNVPTGSLTLSYTGLGGIDLHSSGAFPGSPLVLDLFDNVVGTFSLVATYTGAAGSASSGTFTVNSGSGPVRIDGTSFGNGAVASSVNQIDLVFSGAGSFGSSNFSGSSASIAAVPEPASLALLAITGLAGGGGMIRRRRRRAISNA